MARVALLYIFLSLSVFAVAHAQVDPPEYSGLVIEATGDPAGAQIVLQVTVDEDLDPAIAGFDIYRIILAECHDSETRITAQPSPRGAVGHHEFFLSDPGGNEEDVVYIYWVRVVNASREILEHTWFDYEQRLSFASWGDWPVVGIGELVDQGNWAPVLLPCENTCYRGFFVEGVGLESYVNSGQVVKLYGDIYCNFEGCFASVHNVVPAVCPSVSNAGESWGTLKAQFR